MGQLFEAYISTGDRYSGMTSNNFDRIHTLFIERCRHTDIAEQDRHKAFLIMLRRTARTFFFEFLMSKNLDLLLLSITVKERYQTLERTRAVSKESPTSQMKRHTREARPPSLWNEREARCRRKLCSLLYMCTVSTVPEPMREQRRATDSTGTVFLNGIMES